MSQNIQETKYKNLFDMWEVNKKVWRRESLASFQMKTGQ